MPPRFKKAEAEEMHSQTRQLLLDAASEYFSKLGYEKANVDRISKAAGFAKGTVYNYFTSKRDLMLELIDSIAASHFEFIANSVRQEEDPVRRLQRFFEAGFEWISANLAQGRVMLTTLNGPDLDFKERLQQGYAPMFQLVASEILAPGAESGAFRQVDLMPTAGLIMTIYLGFGATVDEQGRPPLPPEQISDFVLHALHV